MIFDRNSDYDEVQSLFRIAEWYGFLYRVEARGLAELKKAAMRVEPLDKYDRNLLENAYRALVNHPEAEMARARWKIKRGGQAEAGNGLTLWPVESSRDTVPASGEVSSSEATTQPPPPPAPEADTLPPPAADEAVEFPPATPVPAETRDLTSRKEMEAQLRVLGPAFSKTARMAISLSKDSIYIEFIHLHFDGLFARLSALINALTDDKTSSSVSLADRFITRASQDMNTAGLLTECDTGVLHFFAAGLLADISMALAEFEGEDGERLSALSQLVISAKQSDELLSAARAQILEAHLRAQLILNPYPDPATFNTAEQNNSRPRDGTPTVVAPAEVSAAPVRNVRADSRRVEAYDVDETRERCLELVNKLGVGSTGAHIMQRHNQLQRILGGAFDVEPLSTVFRQIVRDLDMIARIDDAQRLRPEIYESGESAENGMKAFDGLVQNVCKEIKVAALMIKKESENTAEDFETLAKEISDDLQELWKGRSIVATLRIREMEEEVRSHLLAEFQNEGRTKFDELRAKLMDGHIRAACIITPVDVPSAGGSGTPGGGNAGPATSADGDPEIRVTYSSVEQGEDSSAVSDGDTFGTSSLEYLDAAGVPAAQLASSQVILSPVL